MGTIKDTDLADQIRLAALSDLTIKLEYPDGEYESICNNNLTRLLEKRKQIANEYTKCLDPEKTMQILDTFNYVNTNIKKLIGL